MGSRTRSICSVGEQVFVSDRYDPTVLVGSTLTEGWTYLALGVPPNIPEGTFYCPLELAGGDEIRDLQALWAL